MNKVIFAVSYPQVSTEMKLLNEFSNLVLFLAKFVYLNINLANLFYKEPFQNVPSKLYSKLFGNLLALSKTLCLITKDKFN